MNPDLSFVFEAKVFVGAPIEAGPGQRVVPITGGSVHGPSIQGVVLSGGADTSERHLDFETAEGSYYWMTRSVFVATGERITS